MRTSPSHTGADDTNKLTAKRLKLHAEELAHDDLAGGAVDSSALPEGLGDFKIRRSLEKPQEEDSGGARTIPARGSLVSGSVFHNSGTTNLTRATDPRGSSDIGSVSLDSLSKSGVVDDHSIQELRSFQHSIEVVLCKATDCLMGIDDDLADEVRRLRNQQAKDLVNQAATVMMNRACTFKQLRNVALPSLMSAAWHRSPNLTLSQLPEATPTSKEKAPSKTAVASIVGVLQGWVAGLRKEAKEVRRTYVILLDRVRYLLRCTILVLDGHEEVARQMAPTMAGEDDVDEPFIIDPSLLRPELLQPDYAPDPSWGSVVRILALTTACEALEQVDDFLSDCSDFWLELYHKERMLQQLEATAQELRPALLRGSRQPELPGQLRDCCDQIEAVLKHSRHDDAECEEGQDDEREAEARAAVCGYATTAKFGDSQISSSILNEAEIRLPGRAGASSTMPTLADRGARPAQLGTDARGYPT